MKNGLIRGVASLQEGQLCSILLSKKKYPSFTRCKITASAMKKWPYKSGGLSQGGQLGSILEHVKSGLLKMMAFVESGLIRLLL